MDLIRLEQLVRSEKAAKAFFKRFCWPDGRPVCVKCGHEKVYRLGDQRLRCPACRYTFHDLSRRWISSGGLSCRDWLRLLKLFELGLTANRMAPQLRLTYNTVYKAMTNLRLAILASGLDANQLFSSCSGLDLGQGGPEPGAWNRYPVFGIIEKQGWVFIDLLPNMRAETVLHFNLNFSLKLTRLGNIVYTDRYQRYDALIFCGDDDLPLNYVNIRGKGAYVDSLKGSFWNYARARLKRYNGVSPRRFPLYLKELEFRYNHRDQDLIPLLSERLCAQVPEYAQSPSRCVADASVANQ
ncbi:transposase [Desulfohalovibrio reitneri]|uniref:transposase n=1 Tax=Desulfohalovibrio reitneri TaxID=1307759 RepID=UPI00068F9DB2|nr:transposase [Desulfohalovibrio reitneri]